MTTKPALSRDAILFAFGYLNGPKAKLSFGGEGAAMRITDRARAALDELIAAGYAEPSQPEDQIPGREHYRGVTRDPHIGALAQDMGINPFLVGKEDRFTSFEKTPETETFEPGL